LKLGLVNELLLHLKSLPPPVRMSSILDAPRASSRGGRDYRCA